MKIAKVVIAVLVVLIYATIAMASGSDTTSGSVGKETVNSSATVSAAPSEQATQTFGLNETAVFPTLKITATDVQVSTGNDFFKPNSGNIFVGIKFSIENVSSDDQTISSILLFDPYVDDTKTDLSITAISFFTSDAKATTLDGTLSAGKKMVGYYGVEVPKGSKTIELDIKSSWLSDQKAVFKIDIPQK